MTSALTLTGPDMAHSRIGLVARHAIVTKVRGTFIEFDAVATSTSTNQRTASR